MNNQILQSLFEDDNRVKDLSTIQGLTKSDLKYIRDKVFENSSKVFFINWKSNEVSISREFKAEIERKLVENILNSGELVIDLSECELDRDFLQILVDGIKTNAYIGHVIYGEKNEMKFKEDPIVYKIKKYLKRNNNEFQRFPNDYTHCLITAHCRKYETSEQIWRKLQADGWRIEENQVFDFEKKGYKSIIYMNESKRQMVLAFRGIKLEIRDLFAMDGQPQAFVYSTMGNQIYPQTVYAYYHTQAAIELCKERGNFNLSFTGYSFGAWLAEQSVFFCHKDFDYKNVRAVTFESPGSLEFITQLAQSHIVNKERDVRAMLNSLDIRTYLMAPNFLNTCNEHVGKVYRLFGLDLDQKRDTLDTFIREKLIENIPIKKVKERIRKCYEIKVRPLFGHYLFYLDGLKSLFTDDIDLILDEFDGQTEKLKKPLCEVYSWPKMNFKPDINNFKSLIDVNLLMKVVPIPGVNRIPKSVQKLLAKPINAALGGLISPLITHTLSSLVLVVNIILEIVDGRLDTKEPSACFGYDLNLYTHPEGVHTIIQSSESQFLLKYQSKYEIRKANLFEDKLYLNNQYIDSRLNELESRDEKVVIVKQLIELKRAFEINRMWNGSYFECTIKSKTMEIERIREMFLRLDSIELICQKKQSVILMNEVNNVSNERLFDDFGGMKEDNFIKTNARIFEEIEEKLWSNQYIYLYGKSGSGKSTLAREYAYYCKSRNSAITVLFIDASGSFNSNLIKLKRKFAIEHSENKSLLLEIVKDKINHYDFPLLIIFDVVQNFDDIKPFLFDIDKKHKFILTTIDGNIIKNIKVGIEMRPFSEQNLSDYLDKSDIKPSLKEEVLRLMKTNSELFVLPKTLELLVKNINNHPSWGPKEIVKFLKNESNSKYTQVNEDNAISFEMLKDLAFLSGSYIDFEIIKQLNMDKKNEEIENALDYLVKNAYLKKNLDVSTKESLYDMHQSTQNEIRAIYGNNESSKEKILKKIIYVLNLSIKGDVSSYFRKDYVSKIQKLNEHFMAIRKQTWKNKVENSNYIELLEKFGALNLYLLLNYENAMEIFKELNKIYTDQSKSLLENDDKESLNVQIFYLIGESLRNIGSVHNSQGQYAQALKAFNESLVAYKKALSENHSKIGDVLIEIAIAYSKQEKYDEALQVSRESLEIFRKTLADDDPKIGDALNNIGHSLRNKMLFEEALLQLNESLKVYEKTLPSNHSKIGDTYFEIGNVYYQLGNAKLALEYYEKSLKIMKITLPPNHYSFGRILMNIGNIFADSDDPKKIEKALRYYEDSKKIFEKTLPSNHVYIANVLMNIGRLKYDQGNYADATKPLNDSLAILMQTLDPNQPIIYDCKTLIQWNNYWIKQIEEERNKKSEMSSASANLGQEASVGQINKPSNTSPENISRVGYSLRDGLEIIFGKKPNQIKKF